MPGPPSELVFHELPVYVYDGVASCAGCSRVESPEGARLAVDAPSSPLDVAKTLDGGIVASEAFRHACADLPGIDFVPLEEGGELALVEIERVVRIDRFASHVKFGPTCTTCGCPRYATRSGPIRLEADEEVPPGFSRTDITFGDTGDFGRSQPVRPRGDILVDRETAKHLKSASLLGIHLITQP